MLTPRADYFKTPHYGADGKSTFCLLLVSAAEAYAVGRQSLFKVKNALAYIATQESHTDMTAKRIFPPHCNAGSPGEWEEAENDAAPQPESAPGTDPLLAGSKAAKGRAAYAAQEYEIPPANPRGSGFGPMGGLFTDDAAGPVGHGMQAQQSLQERNSGDLLSVIAQDALEDECKKRVCPGCPVKKEANETQLRALADLDNARKRLNREREEQVRFAAEGVLSDLLPTLDNLDLALQHADRSGVCKDFVVGVEMTRKLLLETLAKHGLTQAGAVGEAFDPALHEAVGMGDVPEVPEGHICSLLSTGYCLNGRLLRPAKAMVCKKEEK